MRDRHCGNCLWFNGDDSDEDLHFCDVLETNRPHWGFCPLWRKKEENNDKSKENGRVCDTTHQR